MNQSKKTITILVVSGMALLGAVFGIYWFVIRGKDSKDAGKDSGPIKTTEELKKAIDKLEAGLKAFVESKPEEQTASKINEFENLSTSLTEATKNKELSSIFEKEGNYSLENVKKLIAKYEDEKSKASKDKKTSEKGNEDEEIDKLLKELDPLVTMTANIKNSQNNPSEPKTLSDEDQKKLDTTFGEYIEKNKHLFKAITDIKNRTPLELNDKYASNEKAKELLNRINELLKHTKNILAKQ